MLVNDGETPGRSEVPKIKTIHLGSGLVQGDGALPEQVAGEESDDKQKLLIKHFSLVRTILLLLDLVFDLSIGDEAFHFCQRYNALPQLEPRHRQNQLHRIQVLLLATTL